MSTPSLVILLVCLASIALAEDFKTIKGKDYKNVTVIRVEADGIVVRTKEGISKLYFTELPDDVQARFDHAPVKIDAEAAAARAAARAAEEKRIEEEKAAERERAEKNEEKQRKAEADLKRALDQFQSAEQRATESYPNAITGTLSGQVFVSSERAENFKLGAVQVSLFARDAIDVLLAGLKTYADVKIQGLSPSVDAGKAASGQAHAAGYLSEAADKARNEKREIRDEGDFYHSGSFYFSYLRFPIQTVETDADGKFVMEVPKQGSFVIAAKAQRYVGKTNVGETGIDITEHYYWIQPVSLEGQHQQRVQNLSNNNLTSTPGTSSLIVTQD
jgi:ribosomal protein L12E/L44/L45/RPP1/RPP2